MSSLQLKYRKEQLKYLKHKICKENIKNKLNRQ